MFFFLKMMVANHIRMFISQLRKGHDLRELVVCSIVWGFVVVAIPAARLFDYWRDASASSVDFDGLGAEFISLIPFFLLFLFNDVVLTPVILRQRRVVLYVFLAFASALLMTLIIEFFRLPDDAQAGVEAEGRAGVWGEVPPPKPSGRDGEPSDSISLVRPPEPMFDDDGRMAGGSLRDQPPAPPGEPENGWEMRSRQRPPELGEPRGRDSRAPQRRSFGRLRLGPMMSDFILALMMMCAGTLVKLYLLSDRDKARMRQLAKERTDAELAQLRYQVSPHFMMNTLNNIHALVDVDPERAKDTIVRMSRLMRHMLYDGGKPLVSLQSEADFLRDYVELMRIRYTEAVSVSLSLPDDVADVQLPPLLFINLVENAFKHGVSYAKASFVDVSLSLSEDRHTVNFCCMNSLGSSSPAGSPHGIGVANTRKRLELLCRGRFNLSAVQLADRYVVTLRLSVA